MNKVVVMGKRILLGWIGLAVMVGMVGGCQKGEVQSERGGSEELVKQAMVEMKACDTAEGKWLLKMCRAEKEDERVVALLVLGSPPYVGKGKDFSAEDEAWCVGLENLAWMKTTGYTPSIGKTTAAIVPHFFRCLFTVFPPYLY